MSYRALARSYRSHDFDEVVGQQAVTTTLKNAISSGRIHHGYFFTGTRGVGKTSIARILAKSLNCLSVDEPTVSPCRKCDSCQAVSAGEDVDVIEIDAASNNGVDNIRDLRSNASFRPVRSRFKIYIIDEVHMLSTAAFNALLKTLEEPPGHVKFILATTEPQKVPATIQSRCQRFDFRAIDAASIAEHLARIVKGEKIKADADVLRRVARLANGSMRDALSLLDKLLSYEPKHVTAAVADQIIPPPHDELSFAVMEAVAAGDAGAALTALDHALQSGRTVSRFCDHLIEHARTLMILSVCGDDTDLVDVAGAMKAELVRQSKSFDAATYVYMISLLEELRRNVKFSGSARPLADAAVVRLAMSSSFSDLGSLMSTLGSSAPSQTTNAAAAAKKKRRSPNSAVADKHEPDEGVSGDSSKAVTRAAVPATDEPSPRGMGTISSEQWQRVARDPLVARVKDAVDGTLFSVEPGRNAEAQTSVGGPDGEDGGKDSGDGESGGVDDTSGASASVQRA